MLYKKEIDGLRAVAVVPVILYHAGIKSFSGGFIGVDIFYVISGYLITAIIVNDLELNQFSFKDFYIKRFRRIVPQLALMMAFSLVFAWLWMLPNEMKSFCRSLIAVNLLSSNIYFFITSGYFDYSSNFKPLIHTWSISIEEQFYLIYPIFLALFFGKYKKYLSPAITIAFGISVASMEITARLSQNFAFYMLPTRVWELLAGCLLVILSIDSKYKVFIDKKSGFLRNFVPIFGASILIYCILYIDDSIEYPSLVTLLPVIGACILIISATKNTFMGRFLVLKPLVAIGSLSYALYIWHQPIFSFFRIRFFYVGLELRLVFTLTLLAIVSYITWRYVELPLRKNRQINSKVIVIPLLILISTFVLFGYVGNLNNGYPQRFSSSINALLEIYEQHNILRDDGGCNNHGKDDEIRGCIKGDISKKPTFALIGDSHASSLAHEMDILFKKKNISFIQYTKNTCPLAFNIESNPNNNCSNFQKKYLADLTERKINKLVIVSRWSFYPESYDFNNLEGGIDARGRDRFYISKDRDDKSVNQADQLMHSYKDSLITLLNAGKEIVLVYPIPEQGWNVPDYLARIKLYDLQLDGQNGVWAKVYLDRNKKIIDIFDSIPSRKNFYRLKPQDIFCDQASSGRCMSNHDLIPLYYDYDHLSNFGASMLLKNLDKNNPTLFNYSN
jgi:peptidoglycan/LPS O-acetylase OafA/YrhL